MTKWKWLLTSLMFHYGCSTYNISSEVCLEKSFAFAMGDKGCSFTLEEAETWLKKDSSICPRKCHVKISDLEKAEWGIQPKYQLAFITLNINDLMEESKMIKRKCRCSFKDERVLEIICRPKSENLDMSKDLCTLTQNCTEESKTCVLTGQTGICKCKPEYIEFENKCLKRKLQLNETCQLDEQCSMAFGSVCLNDTCGCRHGYVPMNDSECFQRTPDSDGNSQAIIKDQKENNAVTNTVTIGAAFGGFILGIVLTVVVGTIYQHLRYGKFKTKEHSSAAVFNNATYETETDVLQKNPIEHRTNERKVVNVPPFTEELHKSRSGREDIKRSMESNDVYNHLHEKERNPDVDENYDHAHGNINHKMEESDYTNLNTGRNYKGSNFFTAKENDYDVQENVDDYCSLKQ